MIHTIADDEEDLEEDLEVELEVPARRYTNLACIELTRDIRFTTVFELLEVVNPWYCPSPQVPNAGTQPPVHQSDSRPQYPNLEQQFPLGLPWHVYREPKRVPQVPLGDTNKPEVALVVGRMELVDEVLVDEKRVVDLEVLVVAPRPFL